MKRVAVTGLGVISPVGNDVPTFWNALCSGTCGIGPITKFDATDYPVKLAAEVRDFDPRQYMEKLDIMHSDVYTHFAMAAACQAVADSGIAGTLDAERVGVYIGSGIGGGTLLMVWMTGVAALPQQTAQGINLLYFLASAACALFFHIRNRLIRWDIVLPAALGGCVTAAIAAWIATGLDVSLLRRLFGGFLLLTGLRELFFRQQRDKNAR